MPSREEKDEFFQNVLFFVREHDMNYLEAIIHYCSELDMEMETAVLLIDDRLKALVAQQAEDLHLIQRIGRLPL